MKEPADRSVELKDWRVDIRASDIGRFISDIWIWTRSFPGPQDVLFSLDTPSKMLISHLFELHQQQGAYQLIGSLIQIGTVLATEQSFSV